jgi:hypothetical protein
LCAGLQRAGEGELHHPRQALVTKLEPPVPRGCGLARCVPSTAKVRYAGDAPHCSSDSAVRTMVWQVVCPDRLRH